MTNSSSPAVRRDAAWLDAHWMPFTANRQFKADPRLIVAGSGAYYTDADGRKIFDGLSGLWCCGLGHGRKEIAEAIGRQATQLDYAPAFQFGHPLSFELANKIKELTPAGLDHVFFTGSGSESADTSLKMARAYWRAKGKGTKTRLIGREKGYHGVNFGGISVGGIGGNRKLFGQAVDADHLPHTQLASNVFSRGQAEQGGVELADRLLDLIALHDASNIAAVIVEPFAGSAGVLVPPKGYLQRLRAICDKHDILLIFDEVITGFGRVGTAFAAERFGVRPDMITMAKGMTNAAVPMGGVAVSRAIYETMMEGADAPIELFHGYTYSGHPLACAAGLATLDTYAEEGLFERAAGLAGYWEAAMHSLADARHVIDVRNFGLMAAIELEPRPGEAGERGAEVFADCFDRGALVRVTGDTIALSPPLIIEKAQIDQLVEIIREGLARAD
jgi:beta-alanine--pyruvate transaminase